MIGGKKGRHWKCSKEHNEKTRLSKLREKNPNWKNYNIKQQSGSCNARRWFKIRPCEVCGKINGRIDRHHKDGNEINNAPENIQFLCRKHHMIADGRMAKIMTRINTQWEKDHDRLSKIVVKNLPYFNKAQD